jgi:selenocysteine lyase/cysteine desulfurase
LEHNSVLRPLEFLRKSGAITYDVCPLTYGKISPDVIAALIKPNTKMVVVTSASNVTGDAPPLRQIRKAIPEKVLLVCDGAQGAGHIPLRMKETGIDALALAGHKGMMGIQGSGALLFSERMSPRPLLFGGTGSESYSLDMPDFYPDKLEAGTLDFPAIAALFEGVGYLAARGEKTAELLTELSAYLLERLKRISALRIYSRPNACGIVAFAHRNIQSEFLAQALSDKYDIAVRGGLHCAPLAHRALGTEENGLVRVSLSEFNRKKELDILLEALRAIDG